MSEPAIRIVAGHPDAEELAAVLLVLLAAGRRPDPVPSGPPAAGWRRLDRIPGHRGPRSWRDEPAGVAA